MSGRSGSVNAGETLNKERVWGSVSEGGETQGRVACLARLGGQHSSILTSHWSWLCPPLP